LIESKKALLGFDQKGFFLLIFSRRDTNKKDTKRDTDLETKKPLKQL